MPKFYSDIDLKRNELQHAVVHSNDGTPTGTAAAWNLAGQIYYDNADSNNISLYLCITSGDTTTPAGTWRVIDWTHSGSKTGVKVTAASGSTPAHIDNDFSTTSLAALNTNPVADDLMIIQENSGSAFKGVKMSELAGYVNGLLSIPSVNGATDNGIVTWDNGGSQLQVESAFRYTPSTFSLGTGTSATAQKIERSPRTDDGATGAFTIAGQNAAGGVAEDSDGGDLNLYGGLATGHGVGGDIIFKVNTQGNVSAGSAIGTLDKQWTFAATGITTFPGTITSASAQDLVLSSPADIHFKIDSDNDTTNHFEWYNGADTEIAALDESGNLQIDGTLTIGGASIAFDSLTVTGIQTATEVENGGTVAAGWDTGDDMLVTTNGIKAYIDAQNFSTADGNTSDGMLQMQFKTDQGPAATAGSAAIVSGLNGAAQVYATEATSGTGAGMTVKFPNASGGAAPLNDIEIVDGGANYKVGDAFKVAHPTSGGYVVEDCLVATLYGAISEALGAPGTGILKLIGGTGIISQATDGTPDTIAIALKSTGVVAATYGDGTNVPQIAVDAQGRITSASDVTITAGSSNTITLAGGTALEVDSVTGEDGIFTLNQTSDETIALKHSAVGNTPTTSTPAAIGNGGTFDALTSITINTEGHVTGANTATFTLPTSSTGTVTGTGTQNNIAKFSSGGAAIEDSSITDDGSTVAVTGAVTISGDLTVNGTTTTVNSETVTVEDPIFTLANYNTVDTKDRGIEFLYGAAVENNISYQVFANGNTRVTSTAHGHTVGSVVTLSGSGFADSSLTDIDFIIDEVTDDTYTFATPGATTSSFVINLANTAATVSPRGFFGLNLDNTRFTALKEASNTSEVFSGTLMDAEFGDVYSNGTQLENYTHYTQSTIASDTGALTGATVVSDLNIQVDAEGHTTTAAISTRDLTLGDLGYSGTTDANTYVLPTNLAANTESIDTGALTGATVISDLDLNISNNTSGLVTSAGMAVSTRDLTLSDLGLTLRTNVSEIDVDEASGNFATTGDALITHSWSTQDVIVQCYLGGELIHVDVTLADATVALHFDKIPATNPKVIIMEAAGTAHTTTAPSYPA